jgi:SAM-dependent methyltransferase
LRLGPDDLLAYLREAVRVRYGKAARTVTDQLAAADREPSCCGGSPAALGGAISRDLYPDEAASASQAAFAASLGYGNPTLLADLAPGETVLDLGSGGGLDVLLSARRVAPGGKAYGLDMTPEMLELARRNQRDAGVEDAEFLEGTIEAIPLPDACVDVIISNCVINLSADKDAVFAEAFRVLRPGGRFAVSDIVVLRPLPVVARRLMRVWTGCVAGALLDSDYVAALERAGFADASVEVTRRYDRPDLVELARSADSADIPADVDIDALIASLDGAVASASTRARRPLV